MTQIKTLLRSFVNFTALVIGVSAGVAQLADLRPGPGKLVLTGVGVTCLVFLVIRWWYLYYDAKIEELNDQLGERTAELATAQEMIVAQQDQLLTLQVGHRGYLDAIISMVDQADAAFRERLEITVTVGVDDDADTVVERHHTVPVSRLPHRSFRPILNSEDSPMLDLDDMGLRAELLDGAAHITALPLVKDGHLHIWLVFDPALTTPTEWLVSYKSRALWAPLRARGSDYLTWTDRLQAGNGDRSVLDDLVVKFVFPASRQPPVVSERHRFGAVAAARPTDGGDGWLVEFHDRQPAGRRYKWDLVRATAR